LRASFPSNFLCCQDALPLSGFFPRRATFFPSRARHYPPVSFRSRTCDFCAQLFFFAAVPPRRFRSNYFFCLIPGLLALLLLQFLKIAVLSESGQTCRHFSIDTAVSLSVEKMPSFVPFSLRFLANPKLPRTRTRPHHNLPFFASVFFPPFHRSLALRLLTLRIGFNLFPNPALLTGLLSPPALPFFFLLSPDLLFFWSRT